MNDLAGKSILVVEDEELLLDILNEELGALGCQVQRSQNGSDAWKKISKESFDLVITDVRMPGGDGGALLKKITGIKGKRPHVYLVSGYTDITEAEAIKTGALGLIPKPYDLEEILTLVKKALAA